MKRILSSTVIAAAFVLPFSALAAGSDSATPPKPSETTTQCQKGMVWDSKAKKCANPQNGSLDDETLYGAAREFAYAGQYGNTLATLDAMSNQRDDRVLTYRGFAARKMGDFDAGMAYYRAALEVNPDNLLVRSYMGQALVEQGLIDAAREQLTEIRTRGGRSSWPEYALRSAIGTGKGFSY